MKKNKLRLLNRLSLAMFLASSLSLLFIPFVNLTNGASAGAWVVAAIFWAGLAGGLSIQIYLSRKCRLKLSKEQQKRQKWFYLISGASLLLLFIFMLSGISSLLPISLCLSITLLSAEAAAILKKELCLK